MADTAIKSRSDELLSIVGLDGVNKKSADFHEV